MGNAEYMGAMIDSTFWMILFFSLLPDGRTLSGLRSLRAICSLAVACATLQPGLDSSDDCGHFLSESLSTQRPLCIVSDSHAKAPCVSFFDVVVSRPSLLIGIFCL